MKIIKDKISINEIKEMTERMFGNLVKAVVDVEKEIIAEEALLLAKGSKQKDLWGINLYPDIKDDDWIEFDSMINLKPSQGNRTRGVDDEKIRKK
jgi:hypothetical protein